jgi:replicative DNA helicase
MAMARDLLVDAWPERLQQAVKPTGLAHLDALIGGAGAGSLWLLMGTPGVGRTVLACQFALNAALAGHTSVTILSGRESAQTFLANMVCALGRVPADGLFAGALSSQERDRLADACEQIRQTELRVLSRHDDAWHFVDSRCVPELSHLIGGR